MVLFRFQTSQGQSVRQLFGPQLLRGHDPPLEDAQMMQPQLWRAVLSLHSPQARGQFQDDVLETLMPALCVPVGLGGALAKVIFRRLM